MPINHITIVGIKADTSSQEVEEMLVEVRNLLREIPGVTNVAGGRALAGQTSDATHAAVTTVEDRDALAVFDTHPKHDEARKLLGPFVESVSAIDYEIDDP